MRGLGRSLRARKRVKQKRRWDLGETREHVPFLSVSSPGERNTSPPHPVRREAARKATDVTLETCWSGDPCSAADWTVCWYRGPDSYAAHQYGVICRCNVPAVRLVRLQLGPLITKTIGPRASSGDERGRKQRRYETKGLLVSSVS